MRFSTPEAGSHLVTAEVSWPPVPGPASHPARYILRWEAGQLLSVLLTNETSASVPLLNPEVSLRVEVGLLDSDLVSASLTIVAPPWRSLNTTPTTQTSVEAESTPAGSHAPMSSMSTATKVTLSVAVLALVVLLAVLAILVAVLKGVAARGGRLVSRDEPSSSSSRTQGGLLKFDKFLEKNRLSHINLAMM